MNHSDFYISLEFWMSGKRYRCTDVGTRTVIAICLEPHEVTSQWRDPVTGERNTRTYVTDDPRWHEGPPYAIVEHVLDECGIPACTLTLGEDKPLDPDEERAFWERAVVVRSGGPKAVREALDARRRERAEAAAKEPVPLDRPEGETR